MADEKEKELKAKAEEIITWAGTQEAKQAFQKTLDATRQKIQDLRTAREVDPKKLQFSRIK
ncbi:MAG: hypothetical protein IIA17_07425 [candidate division Zixibacteria bacterium]|nr:hypothetical protein [candidate division Zixibacteria bacterium]